MTSRFKVDAIGYYANHDPQAKIRYGFTCWLVDRTFSTISWEISPQIGSPASAFEDSEINAVTVTIDGVVYAIGKVASVEVFNLSPSTTYTVTLHATFDDGQRDDRSFRLICGDQ